MTESQETIIGRVLRASTRGYTCGTHSTKLGFRHDFGAFVKVPIANDGSMFAVGLVYAVEIKDDLLVSELVMAESVDPNILRDQRENRMIPVEVSVLNIGFGMSLQQKFIYSLPPRPPMSLSVVYECTQEDVYHFTHSKDFFRLVLNASEVPSDDLLASMLQIAMQAYPKEERQTFLIESGRAIAKLLSHDTRRLGAILSLIKP